MLNGQCTSIITGFLSEHTTTLTFFEAPRKQLIRKEDTIRPIGRCKPHKNPVEPGELISTNAARRAPSPHRHHGSPVRQFPQTESKLDRPLIVFSTIPEAAPDCVPVLDFVRLRRRVHEISFTSCRGLITQLGALCEISFRGPSIVQHVQFMT
jgi:hypothetical protein